MAKSASRTARTIQILMRIRAALPPRCPHLIAALAPALGAFDAQHIELAFDVAEGGPGHLSSRNPWTERGLLQKAIARRLGGRRAISTGWVMIRTRPAGRHCFRCGSR